MTSGTGWWEFWKVDYNEDSPQEKFAIDAKINEEKTSTFLVLSFFVG